MKDEQEFKNKLQTIIAGETIVWGAFERYMTKASPITLSTLMKAIKVEAYLNATQDKVLSPGMKIALGTIFVAAVVAALVWLIISNTM